MFEKWDTAGKGESINILVHVLNSKGYNVVPVAAPVRDEMVHSYL